MKDEQFDSWDEFNDELPIQQTPVLPSKVETEVLAEPAPTPLPKPRGGRRKKQIETPVEITEEVEPVERNTVKEV